MPLRLCPICRTKIPSSEYEKHRQAHKNEGKQPHWSTEGLQARKQALKRDGYRCQKCGRTKRQLDAVGIQLHVHHVDENRKNNALSNLLTLCADCHPRGAKKQPRD